MALTVHTKQEPGSLWNLRSVTNMENAGSIQLTHLTYCNRELNRQGSWGHMCWQTKEMVLKLVCHYIVWNKRTWLTACEWWLCNPWWVLTGVLNAINYKRHSKYDSRRWILTSGWWLAEISWGGLWEPMMFSCDLGQPGSWTVMDVMVTHRFWENPSTSWMDFPSWEIWALAMR